jgi:hypothetical protein
MGKARCTVKSRTVICSRAASLQKTNFGQRPASTCFGAWSVQIRAADGDLRGGGLMARATPLQPALLSLPAPCCPASRHAAQWLPGRLGHAVRDRNVSPTRPGHVKHGQAKVDSSPTSWLVIPPFVLLFLRGHGNKLLGKDPARPKVPRMISASIMLAARNCSRQSRPSVADTERPTAHPL